MEYHFITSLSQEADNVDFRVLADVGGYTEMIEGLYDAPVGKLTITAQRDKLRVSVQILVDCDSIARDGDLFCFDGFIGEFLNFDGQPTGTYVTINHLSIDPKATQYGQTVGVLKMTQVSELPAAM